MKPENKTVKKLIIMAIVIIILDAVNLGLKLYLILNP